MAYAAKVIADSVYSGSRLTTLEVTFPRIILSEFNTHRVFSRNSASSRAIPIERQIELVMSDPFIPIYWGRNQSGMQALAELSVLEEVEARASWLVARDNAVASARWFLEIGVHKQITNRLLEPFMWHTVVVSSTEWGNFFGLRKPPFRQIDPTFPAQPEIQKIAILMKEAMLKSSPVEFNLGDWHLPYFSFDVDTHGIDMAKKMSVARCARVSYLRQNDENAIDLDVALHDRLLSSGHMSPFEHVATPFVGNFFGNFKGWAQYRNELPFESDYSLR